MARQGAEFPTQHTEEKRVADKSKMGGGIALFVAENLALGVAARLILAKPKNRSGQRPRDMSQIMADEGEEVRRRVYGTPTTDNSDQPEATQPEAQSARQPSSKPVGDLGLDFLAKAGGSSKRRKRR